MKENKRVNSRIKVPENLDIYITIGSSENKKYPILDMSIGGVGFQIPGELHDIENETSKIVFPTLNEPIEVNIKVQRTIPASKANKSENGNNGKEHDVSGEKEQNMIVGASFETTSADKQREIFQELLHLSRFSRDL